MAGIYIMGLIVAVLAGCAIGWLATLGHFQRVASQHREYEKEMAEAEEYHVARAIIRHMKPNEAAGGNEPIE